MNCLWQRKRQRDTIARRAASEQDSGIIPIFPQSYKTIIRLFLIAVIGTHMFFLWSVRDRVARGDPDFTALYSAGKILREGRGTQLYDARTQLEVQQEFTTNSEIRRGPLPYVHPPFEAPLFLPFTFLSYRNAFVLWNFFGLALLCGVILLLRSSLNSLRQVASWDLILASLAFFPIFANFHQGQDAILLLFVVVLGFRALERHVEFVAGCWFGIGLFRYHLILPLILILVVWRGTRIFFGFATLALIAIVLSLGIVGWHGALLYPAYAWSVVTSPGRGGIPHREIPNLLGLMTGWPLLEKLGWPLQLAVLSCAAGLLFLTARLNAFANQTRLVRLCVACAVISAVLFGFNTNTYDLSLLILPLALVADYCMQQWAERRMPSPSLFLPAMPLLLSPFWFFLWMRWQRVNLMAIFLLWWFFAIRREILRASAGVPANGSTA